MSPGEKRAAGPELRVIQGGLQREISFRGLLVVAAPPENSPFRVEAEVLEEDTFLVMSADLEVREPSEPVIKIMTRLLDTEPQSPGSVLLREGNPLRFLAVVHDFNQEPTWREEWIAKALESVFRKAESRHVESLVIPLLCTKYGRLEERRFVVLLRDALEKTPLETLKRLWLMVPKGRAGELLKLME